MTHTKPLLRTFSGQPQTPPPIWFMRQAGRYLPEYQTIRSRVRSFLDLCLTPELASEVTLQPIRRFDLDGAIIFADILLVPYALGQTLWFEEGAGPRLEPLEGPDAIGTLSGTAFHATLAPMYSALRQTAAHLPAGTALIGFAGAPWTVASYMLEGRSSRDFAITKTAAYAHPAAFQQLMDRLVDVTADYLSAQIEAGAEAVQLFDSWAGVLPADQVERWSLVPLQRIVERLKIRHPGVPVILFPRGTGPMYARFARESDADVLSLDTSLSPAWAADNVQPHVGVQGNLDPHRVVVGGEGMRTAVDGICQPLAGGPHVFNLGHGVTPDTPPAHVADLVRSIRGEHG